MNATTRRLLFSLLVLGTWFNVGCDGQSGNDPSSDEYRITLVLVPTAGLPADTWPSEFSVHLSGESFRSGMAIDPIELDLDVSRDAATSTYVAQGEIELPSAAALVLQISASIEGENWTGAELLETEYSGLHTIQIRVGSDDVVVFPDAVLEAAVRSKIERAAGDLHVSDLNSVTRFSPHPPSGSDIVDLSGMEAMTSLVELDIENQQVSDITPIQNLLHLEVLLLSENLIVDLSPLENLVNLKGLYIYHNYAPNHDISPLSSLVNLQSLNLGNMGIADIAPLQELHDLRYLLIAGNPISNLSPLSGLTELYDLTIGTSNVTDLTPISTLTNLRHLDFRGIHVTNLNALTNMSELEELVAYSCEISNISAVSNLGNLEYLHLYDNLISNISPLENQTTIKYLYLSNNLIEDISALEDLQSLIELGLSDNFISNLTPIRNLPELESVSLRNNQISNIFSIANNQGIASGDNVYLEGNPLSDNSLNVYIPALLARGVNVTY